MSPLRACLLRALVIALCAAPSLAHAEFGRADTVPAATLLLPYFEVVPGDPTLATTLVAVVNGGTEPVAARVDLWTDLGINSFTFFIPLHPGDIQTWNLRDLLVGGVVPGFPGSPFEEPVVIPGCFPDFQTTPIPPEVLLDLQAMHSGQPIPTSGSCAGHDHGDGALRGYITIDAVQACDPVPTHIEQDWIDLLSHENVLWGDFTQIISSRPQLGGGQLVHIESNPDQPGEASFYSAFGQPGAGPQDFRERLSPRWGTRYLNIGQISNVTDLIIWRGPTEYLTPFTCGEEPVLGSVGIVAFDEEENPQFFTPPEFPDIAPLATNRIRVGSAALPLGPDGPSEFRRGWMLYDDTFEEGGGQAAVYSLTLETTGVYMHGYRGLFGTLTRGVSLGEEEIVE